MYKYIALTALVLGSAALGFNINRGGEEQFTVGLVEDHAEDWDPAPNDRTFIIDLDLDGFDDMVQVNLAEGEDSTLLYVDLRAKMNQGDMSFSSWESIGTYDLDPLPGMPGAKYLRGARLMNVNGDPYPDLVFVAEENNGGDVGFVTVYLINNGLGGFTCAGDVTGDGTTDVNDLLGVIGDWGCTEEGLPD